MAVNIMQYVHVQLPKQQLRRYIEITQLNTYELQLRTTYVYEIAITVNVQYNYIKELLDVSCT